MTAGRVNHLDYHAGRYLLVSPRPGRTVDLWSVKRLPFEPSGWLKGMRDDIREAVRTLQYGSDEVLHATYMSNVDESCDAENILLYNVGPSYFARCSSVGLRFERVFEEPPPPPRPLKEQVLHYHRYAPAKRHNRFVHWRSQDKLVQWETSCEALGASTSATSIWYWMKRGVCEARGTVRREPSRFGLTVTIRAPTGSLPNLAALVKPLFDGIISAFHSHDGAKLQQVSHRIAAKLDVEAAEVAEHLLSDNVSVLGRKQLVWPWRESVQWNPADELCVAGELVLLADERRGSPWQLSGQLFRVDD